jgi:hypothetical protein
LWNAERDSQGFFLTRQMIVPDGDVVIRDTVASWRSPGLGSMTLRVTVPENTPPTDFVGLQFNPFAWFEPLPMWPDDQGAWSFVLYGPLDFTGPLAYRYCRNLQCGIADDADTPGANPAGRRLAPTKADGTLSDEVREWRWWKPDPPRATILASDIAPRPGFEAGVDLLPAYRPSWGMSLTRALENIRESGANAVVFTPTWTLKQPNPVPLLAFDPAHGPFDDELQATLAEAARLGLQPVLRPALRTLDGETDQWWRAASRDPAWWTVWFERYRAFALTYARAAAEAGAVKLVLGGPEVRPALPGGLLADGTPSGVPPQAETLWRELIVEVRARFPGRLAFEIELGESLQPPPPFLDVFDEVHIYWHAPLTSGTDATTREMQAASATWLDGTVLATPSLAGMPIVLSVEYLSVDGGASACAKAPDGTCRSPSSFDQGAVVDPDLKVDLLEQAQAINAVLLEAYARPQITGFYVRRYHPVVALQDRSASVNGKPAWDVLWYWYARITGR